MNVSRSTLLKQLPPYQAREILIKDNQGVFDIMKEIGKTHSLYAGDYDKIYHNFFTGNLETTCRKIFEFCKINLVYVIEQEKQSTRSPSSIVALGETFGVDCKHYSLFIAGLCDSIRRNTDMFIDWEYRFASYRFWDPTPHHVFVVVKDKGKEIWLDPVLSAYNEKKLYTAAISKKINTAITKKFTTMPLVRMSGTDYNNVGSLKTVLKKVVTVVKKVSVAVPRNSILSLIALNVHGMATKLQASLQDKVRRPKLQALWEKLGGNFKSFEQTVNSGAKKKKILGVDATNQVGVVIAIPAVLAAAAPIIAALAAFLKGGGGPGEIATDPALEQIANDAIETLKAAVKTGTPQVITVPGVLPAGGGVLQQQSEVSEQYAGTEQKTIIPGVPNIALYIGGAGLAYFMFKKR